MPTSPAGATLPDVEHHVTEIDGGPVHFVTAGATGSPVLLAHGFPESWWAFRGVIPLLADHHRVIAVDMPGFGDSGHDPDAGYSSASVAESLSALIEQLDLGPVHLTGQDIAGPATFRLTAAHPELIRSFAGIETGLPGFGWEALADVTHGGTWHIGLIAAPGIPEMLLAGREHQFLADYAIPAMTAGTGAVTDSDIDEFTRVYSQTEGFAGAAGLYRSMLAEGDELKQIVASGQLTLPVLSVAAGTGPFTHQTMHAVAENVTEANLSGIGHLAALEDPRAFSETLMGFYRTLDT